MSQSPHPFRSSALCLLYSDPWQGPVSPLLPCNKLPQNKPVSNKSPFILFTVLQIRHLAAQLGSSPAVCRGGAARCQLGLQAADGPSGLDIPGLPFTWLVVDGGRWLRPQLGLSLRVPTRGLSSMGVSVCSECLFGGQFPLRKVSREPGGGCMTCCDLASDIMQCFLHSFLLAVTRSRGQGEGTAL